jgi:hypothetical protein
LPYDPATMALLNVYPTEMKVESQTNDCISMFITAFFTIAKR